MVFVGIFQQRLTTRERELIFFVFPFPLPSSCIHPILGISKKVQQHLYVILLQMCLSNEWVLLDIFTEKLEDLRNPDLPHCSGSPSHIKAQSLILTPTPSRMFLLLVISHEKVLLFSLKGFLFVFLQQVLGKRQSPYFECLDLYILGTLKSKCCITIFCLVSYPKVHTQVTSS